MIGAQRLEQAPETMTDMQRNDDHGRNVKNDIRGALKSVHHNLVYGGGRFVDKMKIQQVKNNEPKNDKTGIRHGCRADRASTGPFVHVVALWSGHEILEKQDGSGGDMNKGQCQESPLGQGDKRTESMKVFGIGIEHFSAAVQGQVACKVSRQETDETTARQGH